MNTYQVFSDSLQVHLRWDKGMSWTHLTRGSLDVWVKGSAFKDGCFFQREDFASLVLETIDSAPVVDHKDQLVSLLSVLNGTFAIVIRGDGWLLAGVDRIRSIPLFHGQGGDTLYISDDADWVRRQLGDAAPDPLSIEEFRLTGYVTGPDTLYPNVKQLQAGEWLWWTTTGKPPGPSTDRYYRFVHLEPETQVGPEDLVAQLDVVSEASIERLIEYAAGRQIVVPLSGGLDSRAIVSMLRRLGHEEVVAYSYGIPGNRESRVSRHVAESLGYRWEFVEYSKELWRRWYRTPERRSYQRYASGWVSLPHIQDWPAVWALREQKRIRRDAILVPGHTAMLAKQAADVLRLATETHLTGVDLLHSAILEGHYSLKTRDRDSLSELFGDKLHAIVAGLPTDTLEQVVSTLDLWAWQERQAKFIVNSVRVYEFWGYDWWLPWWDSEFVAFWEGVPLRLRVDKRLYDEYVNRLFNELTGRAYVPDLRRRSNVRSKLKAIINRVPMLRAMSDLCLPLRRAAAYRSHPMAISGRYPEGLAWRLFRRGCTSNGIAAYAFLDEFVCRP